MLRPPGSGLTLPWRKVGLAEVKGRQLRTMQGCIWSSTLQCRHVVAGCITVGAEVVSVRRLSIRDNDILVPAIESALTDGYLAMALEFHQIVHGLRQLTMVCT